MGKWCCLQNSLQLIHKPFIIGLRHRWTYYLRTLPDIEELLEPPENAMTLTGHTCTPNERELLALPVRLGGLGIENPCQTATKDYEVSIRVTATAPLLKQIEAQALELPDDNDIRKLQQQNRRENDEHLGEGLEEVKS